MNREKQTPPDRNAPKLLDAEVLERSEIVANACMNRARNLSGANSYEADLGLAHLEFLKKVLQKQDEVTWLDLCCGAGRALLQAADAVQRAGLAHRVKLTGVDLVPMFDPIPNELGQIGLVRLVSASAEKWETDERFDLITCVHGLHYVGDKLRVLHRTAGWLKADGLLMVHLDYRNLRIAGRKNPGAQIGRDLHRAGFEYIPGRRLLVRKGDARLEDLPYRYLGADDKAGPNYTGQAAVDSYYERIKS